jgi:hypothetical protein
MPIVALAFHEHIAMEKLDVYFVAPQSAGETRPAKCGKCSLEFAVVL